LLAKWIEDNTVVNGMAMILVFVSVVGESKKEKTEPPPLQIRQFKRYPYFGVLRSELKQHADYWTRASKSIMRCKYHRHRKGFQDTLTWYLQRAEYDARQLRATIERWGQRWDRNYTRSLYDSYKRYLQTILLLRKTLPKEGIRDV